MIQQLPAWGYRSNHSIIPGCLVWEGSLWRFDVSHLFVLHRVLVTPASAVTGQHHTVWIMSCSFFTCFCHILASWFRSPMIVTFLAFRVGTPFLWIIAQDIFEKYNCEITSPLPSWLALNLGWVTLLLRAWFIHLPNLPGFLWSLSMTVYIKGLCNIWNITGFHGCFSPLLLHQGMFCEEEVVCYAGELKKVFKCHVRIVFYFLKEINV